MSQHILIISITTLIIILLVSRYFLDKARKKLLKQKQKNIPNFIIIIYSLLIFSIVVSLFYHLAIKDYRFESDGYKVISKLVEFDNKKESGAIVELYSKEVKNYFNSVEINQKQLKQNYVKSWSRIKYSENKILEIGKIENIIYYYKTKFKYQQKSNNKTKEITTFNYIKLDKNNKIISHRPLELGDISEVNSISITGYIDKFKIEKGVLNINKKGLIKGIYKYPSSKYINLVGKIENNKIIINEYLNEKGKRKYTGEFDIEVKGKTLIGKWSNGKKTYKTKINYYLNQNTEIGNTIFRILENELSNNSSSIVSFKSIINFFLSQKEISRYIFITLIFIFLYNIQKIIVDNIKWNNQFNGKLVSFNNLKGYFDTLLYNIHNYNLENKFNLLNGSIQNLDRRIKASHLQKDEFDFNNYTNSICEAFYIISEDEYINEYNSEKLKQLKSIHSYIGNSEYFSQNMTSDKFKKLEVRIDNHIDERKSFSEDLLKEIHTYYDNKEYDSVINIVTELNLEGNYITSEVSNEIRHIKSKSLESQNTIKYIGYTTSNYYNQYKNGEISIVQVASMYSSILKSNNKYNECLQLNNQIDDIIVNSKNTLDSMISKGHLIKAEKHINELLDINNFSSTNNIIKFQHYKDELKKARAKKRRKKEEKRKKELEIKVRLQKEQEHKEELKRLKEEELLKADKIFNETKAKTEHKDESNIDSFLNDSGKMVQNYQDSEDNNSINGDDSLDGFMQNKGKFKKH